jgi:hypothetical protein
MKRLLSLTEDLAVSPCHVTAIRRNQLDDKDTSTVFLEGLQADQGFTVDMPFEDVVDAVNEALAECEQAEDREEVRK